MSDAHSPTVLGYGPHGSLPDLSPFVAKIEIYLMLAGVPYTKDIGDPRKTPRGKLPCLVHGGDMTADSTRIIAYLRERGLADLDDWLDDDQRVELIALQSMIELELYFIVAYFRWQDPHGWAAYRHDIAAYARKVGAPGLLAGLIARNARRNVLAQLHGQGVGRREPDEALARAHELFGALQGFVGRREGPWWFGARPSSADAIVYAFVDSTVGTQLGIPTERLLDDRARLRTWFDHVAAALPER